ncbi:MAG: isocitrate lyase/PEP mutase family protein [Hyphomicrobiaceae bacterium]
MAMTLPIREKFRAMIEGDGMVVAPGCYDGLTATLIARAGFDATYMTGAGTSVAKGLPDYGLMTMTEMVANAATIAEAIDVPLVADADTGYGNELNVTRTIRAFERAGVAAIHLEDQGFPKRCGHLDDKEIIPLNHYLAKIRAAAAARTDPNFMIIARTDARQKMGLEDAVRRANAALDAGADIAFIEAPQTMDELKAVPREVKGPCLFNYVEGGKTPEIDMDQARAFGFKLAILPGILLRNVIFSCENILTDLKTNGQLPDANDGIGVRGIFERVGSAEWDELRHKFSDGDQAEAAE